jgi:hypothetical protein
MRMVRGLKVGMISQVIQTMMCKTLNPDKTNCNNIGGSVGKSYSHVREG